jgi:hypothetical protein
MAIAQAWNQNNPEDFFQTDINTYDYAIGGKMVVAKCSVSEATLITDNIKDAVRTQLIHQIADYILQNKLVEFTQSRDPISLHTIVRARCYLAPNDQIKILRTAYKID